MSAVILQDVYKRFGSLQVVHRISLEVSEREFAAIGSRRSWFPILSNAPAGFSTSATIGGATANQIFRTPKTIRSRLSSRNFSKDYRKHYATITNRTLNR